MVAFGFDTTAKAAAFLMSRNKEKSSSFLEGRRFARLVDGQRCDRF